MKTSEFIYTTLFVTAISGAIFFTAGRLYEAKLRAADFVEYETILKSECHYWIGLLGGRGVWRDDALCIITIPEGIVIPHPGSNKKAL